MRNDYNGKAIKCLIVEDFNTGELVKQYDPTMFEKVIKETDPMFLTKVFVPTNDEKTNIYDLLSRSIVERENQDVVEVSERDMLIEMFLRFTDLDFDVNDEELIKDVLANPNELFVAIKSEMDKILMGILENYVTTVKTLQSNPQTATLLSQQINEKAELVQSELKKKELRKQELLKELEELE